jgi:probable rRNA maturation factor
MPPIPAMPLLGDIVLCVPVIEQEAQEQKKCLMAHYAHLTIHGVLHLQGYDHLRDHDAQMMEKHEIDLLKKLNYANPYANLA